MKSVMYGGGAAAIALLAVGAARLSVGEEFDYALLNEKSQQRVLDEMASALEYGLVRSTGGAVAVREASGDAATDSLLVAGQFVERLYESATDDQVEVVRQSLYENNCNQYATRKVIEDGVAIRFSIARPSGAPLIDVAFDAASCAPYLRASVG